MEQPHLQRSSSGEPPSAMSEVQEGECHVPPEAPQVLPPREQVSSSDWSFTSSSQSTTPPMRNTDMISAQQHYDAISEPMLNGRHDTTEVVDPQNTADVTAHAEAVLLSEQLSQPTGGSHSAPSECQHSQHEEFNLSQIVVPQVYTSPPETVQSMALQGEELQVPGTPIDRRSSEQMPAAVTVVSPPREKPNKDEDSGIQDFLVNFLYCRKEEEIDFYLPQLAWLSLTRYHSSILHRFIKGKAAKSLDFALKASWLFQSTFREYSAELNRNANELHQEVEMAVVNSNPDPRGSEFYQQTDLADLFDMFERYRAVVKVQTSRSRTVPRDLMELEGRELEDRKLPADQEPDLDSLSSRFMRTKGPINLPSASVTLPSIYDVLQHPGSTTDWKDRDVMGGASQYLVKKRRSGYFDTLQLFIPTLIEVSLLLVQEPDKSMRLKLLQKFLYAMNEISGPVCGRYNFSAFSANRQLSIRDVVYPQWMLCRRCSVAAAQSTFELTGLNIPLLEFASLTPSSEATQIVRFLPEESKVLSSKKRAPYLLVYEVAHLDEDLRRLPPIFRLKTQEFAAMTHLPESMLSAVTTEDIQETSLGYTEASMPSWDHLYVYDCILNDLKERGLYVPVVRFSPSHKPSPLQELLHSMGLYAAEDGEESLQQSSLMDDSTVSRSLSEPPLEGPCGFSDSSIQQATHVEQTEPSRRSESPSAGLTATIASTSSSMTQLHVPPLPRHGRRKSFNPSKLSPPITTGDCKSTGDSKGVFGPSYAAFASMWGSGKAGGSARRSEVTESTVPVADAAGPDRAVRVVTTSAESDHSQRPVPSVAEMAAGAVKLRYSLWGDLWQEKKERYRKLSPYGRLKSWNLACVLVKGGDDLRQEMLASQLVRQFKWIFEQASLPLYLRPYEILVTGANSGIMVFVPDTVSVDALKKNFGSDSIAKVFEAAFADNPYEAKKNFIESHAAYSIIEYLLQVKDRHNGNFLLDAEGHVIHIDYGFMLSNSPGLVSFEQSPFKLTQEFMDIMDGEFSDNYEYFRALVVRGFLEARKHAEKLLLLVEMMASATKMPCFAGGSEAALAAMTDRFMINLTEDACVQKVADLIDISVNNWRTIQYDTYQRITNGIL